MNGMVVRMRRLKVAGTRAVVGWVIGGLVWVFGSDGGLVWLVGGVVVGGWLVVVGGWVVTGG